LSRPLDLSGQTFGKLTVINKNRNSKGRVIWDCQCSCGGNTQVLTHRLTTGHTKSCGCGRKYSEHGQARTRIYRTYAKMKARCYRETEPSYKNYGARGIKICDEWLNNFKAFYDWAIANGYSDDLSIERLDVNGDYCPENCTWIPLSEQTENRRCNIMITREGKTQSLNRWSRELGIPWATIRGRMKRGMSFEEAISIMIEGREKK
jgi:hypothetical protein